MVGIPKRFFNIRPKVSGPAVDPPANIVKLMAIPIVIAPITADTGRNKESFEIGELKNKNTGTALVGITVFIINSFPISNHPKSMRAMLMNKFDAKTGIPAKSCRIIAIPVTPPKARLCGAINRLMPTAKIIEPNSIQIKFLGSILLNLVFCIKINLPFGLN